MSARVGWAIYKSSACRCLFRRMKRLEILAQGWGQFFVITLLALGLCACQQPTIGKHTAAVPKLSDKQVAVLNDLRDEINLTYGYVDGWPRIDRGPCGRFAKLFYEHWNERFEHKVTIVF